MMTKHILHIFIGPVQGFVAQARRTRDLWAGSFLLSWMSGQLMAAVLRQSRESGKIVFPSVGTEDAPTDKMLAAILGKPLSEDRHPKIGSLLNRFKAQVPANFDPKVAVEEAKQKWQNLAEMIWKNYVGNAVNENEDQRNLTREIWERQIESFWEIQWVKGDNPANNGEDAKWLDSRKNWRSHWPPEEGGDHCTIQWAVGRNCLALSAAANEKSRTNFGALCERMSGGLIFKTTNACAPLLW